MAIRDTSKKPFIVDNDTNVRVGIDLPIRRGDDFDGFFATTSTTIEAVKNNIRNLLNTNQGERLFQPNLGLDLRSLLFEHIEEAKILLEGLKKVMDSVETQSFKANKVEDLINEVTKIYEIIEKTNIR